MAITKAQLARRAAGKLGILAPNELFGADDESAIVGEIDTLKAQLEGRIFSGVSLWQTDAQIPDYIVPGFLMVLLPTLAPHYGSAAISALPSGMSDEGFRELCRQLAKPYNPDTIDAPNTEPISANLYSETILFIDRCQNYEVLFLLFDGDGDLLNLSGYDARLQARGQSGGPALDVSLSAGTLTLAGIGEIGLALTAAQTSGIPSGRFRYEFELIEPSKRLVVVHKGILMVEAGVIYD